MENQEYITTILKENVNLKIKNFELSKNYNVPLSRVFSCMG